MTGWLDGKTDGSGIPQKNFKQAAKGATSSFAEITIKILRLWVGFLALKIYQLLDIDMIPEIISKRR